MIPILAGDFCYTIWFESLKDAKWFENCLRKKLIFVWHSRVKGDYCVTWDIGVHI